MIDRPGAPPARSWSEAGLDGVALAGLRNMACLRDERARHDCAPSRARTDHVVVVGAGLAGLSAALHLAGRGRSRHRGGARRRPRRPGRQARRRRLPLDTGPTVLTMPDIIDETFAAVGETAADRLELVRRRPRLPRALRRRQQARRAHATPTRWPTAIARFAGPAEAEGYRRLRAG